MEEQAEMSQTEQKNMFNFKTNILQIIVSFLMMTFSMFFGFKLAVTLLAVSIFTRTHWMFYRAAVQKKPKEEEVYHYVNVWAFFLGFIAFIIQYLFL